MNEMNQERGNAQREGEPNMKVQRIRERDAISGDWGGDWRTWLKVSRLDIEPLGIEVTSASSQDASHLYLHGDDIETFYIAMMERGWYFEKYGWSEDARDENGLLRNFVELRGDRQTFEWSEGRSAIRDLESVA